MQDSKYVTKGVSQVENHCFRARHCLQQQLSPSQGAYWLLSSHHSQQQAKILVQQLSKE